MGACRTRGKHCSLDVKRQGTISVSMGSAEGLLGNEQTPAGSTLHPTRVLQLCLQTIDCLGRAGDDASNGAHSASPQHDVMLRLFWRIIWVFWDLAF